VISTRNLLPLAWPKRSKRIQTAVGVAYLRTSRCGLYRVRRSVIHGVPDVFYAQHRHPVSGPWDVISKHRVSNRAVKACEAFARRTHHYLSVMEDRHASAD